MAKRKKHPKLPNGFGSIKYLGKGRTNPYAVHPPTKEFSPSGSPKTPKAICYVDEWYKGFYALMAYNNGTFSKDTIKEITIKDGDTEYDIATKIISSYNNTTRLAQNEKKFTEVYQEFYEYKFNRDKTKVYSDSTKYSTRAAFKNCTTLHDRSFKELRTQDLQKVVDDCPLKHASKELIVSLFNQMYAYADMQDIVDKDYSAHVKINTEDDDEKGVPFTPKEIDILWNHSENNVVRCVLIMVYSGFRIAAYHKIQINTNENYFIGGVKTKAAKNRIVPIHPLIKDFLILDYPLFNVSYATFRILFLKELEKIGITGHTPHDCRHTFSWLCDKYKINPLAKKILLGHSLGNNVTDSKYGHRTVAELREEIEKIKHW